MKRPVLLLLALLAILYPFLVIGGFIDNCTDPEVVFTRVLEQRNFVLNAWCGRTGGQKNIRATLFLDECVENIDGTLVWTKGGNHALHCWDCTAEEDGKMWCYCKRLMNWHYLMSKINLNDNIYFDPDCADDNCQLKCFW